MVSEVSVVPAPAPRWAPPIGSAGALPRLVHLVGTLVVVFSIEECPAVYGEPGDAWARSGCTYAALARGGSWRRTVSRAWSGVSVRPAAAAHLVGLCLGASQSGGRALVGLLSPPSRRAEFFGFWGPAMKLSAIAGPLTYGLVTWATGGDHRRAPLATGLFFLVGLALLTGVHAGRGRRAALRAERDFREVSA